MRTLFQISGDLQALDDLLEDLGGDVSDEQIEEIIDKWFQTLGAERDEKLDNYAALIREVEMRAEARRVESRRLAERVKVDSNRASALKDRLKHFFETHEISKVETSRFRLSLANNGGKLPLVLNELVEVGALPERFKRVTIEMDTEKVRTALEAGETLFFAHLGSRGKSIRIK